MKNAKIAVIGAGKTGRGFIGRLLAEAGEPVRYIDKNKELVRSMAGAGKFTVHFFGGKREDFVVDNFTITTWENADLTGIELILVAVGGTNLPDVGKALAERLPSDSPVRIITCENASHPSETVKTAMGRPEMPVSEATVFCTTIEAEGLDIRSENYPKLQCSAEQLHGYVPPVESITPVDGFGNFLTRKLFTYNAASCIIAYLGWMKGYTSYGEAANDPEILAKLDANYAVSNRVLCRVFGYTEEDQAQFAALSRDKFTNTEIADTIERNAREPHRKLGPEERIIGPMKLIAAQGEDVSVLVETAAAMLLYDSDKETKWKDLRAAHTDGELLEKIAGLAPEDPLYAAITEKAAELRG
ncbi:MAG: hypothetical protein IJ480_12140 [Clostridia bacterium]|nr:hypothetical protein [Clostridia bacterium]